MSAFGLQAQTLMKIHQNNGTVLQIPLNTIDSITYTIPSPGNLATISTLPIVSITSISATSGGNITGNGGTPVTQRGVVWSTSPNPTTANSSTIDGAGTGNYTSNITSLTASTTYYVRAYVTNSAGTAYGNEVSFTTTAGGGGIVTNPGAGVTFNGYTYSSIVLGNGQEWMAENLRTNQYNDGTTITTETDSSQWTANQINGTNIPMMCWYNNDQSTYTANSFGALYNWYSISYTTNGNHNICPVGWHVPTVQDWDSLIIYLDPSYNIGGGSSSAGGKMKSIGTQYWQSPNTDATNESGFSGLPCGRISDLGGVFVQYVYNNIGQIGSWWSNNGCPNPTAAWSYELFNSNGSVSMVGDSKASGKSVRCVRD